MYGSVLRSEEEAGVFAGLLRGKLFKHGFSEDTRIQYEASYSLVTYIASSKSDLPLFYG